ncbi:DUF4097 family beta strand repeat-containing protein [Thermococcus sp.]|uniref:DUF4097 family beta strand repeat-containing protein n=1 Tax=Thermococcus sp. TaxID=35749 RepID=UPI002636E09B|nr:DUF4097 family beta strand repeat-containing protein [Thermococcus sp.]
MRFENVREIRVKAINGLISLEVWENDYTEVNYTVHGDVDIILEQKGDVLKVEERPKKRFRLFGSREGWADIEVKVPKRAIVWAKNINGEIKASGIRFTNVTTVNGDIELRECEAKLIKTINGEIRAHMRVDPRKVSTVNGEIELTVEELDDDMNVNSMNGDATLRLTDFCDARIRAKSVNGDIRFIGIDPDDPVIGAGTFEVEVSTVNGSVRVELI